VLVEADKGVPGAVVDSIVEIALSVVEIVASAVVKIEVLVSRELRLAELDDVEIAEGFNVVAVWIVEVVSIVIVVEVSLPVSVVVSSVVVDSSLFVDVEISLVENAVVASLVDSVEDTIVDMKLVVLELVGIVDSTELAIVLEIDASEEIDVEGKLVDAVIVSKLVVDSVNEELALVRELVDSVAADIVVSVVSNEFVLVESVDETVLIIVLVDDDDEVGVKLVVSVELKLGKVEIKLNIVEDVGKEFEVEAVVVENESVGVKKLEELDKLVMSSDCVEVIGTNADVSRELVVSVDV
jgi:hypothetical protein